MGRADGMIHAGGMFAVANEAADDYNDYDLTAAPDTEGAEYDDYDPYETVDSAGDSGNSGNVWTLTAASVEDSLMRKKRHRKPKKRPKKPPKKGGSKGGKGTGRDCDALAAMYDFLISKASALLAAALECVRVEKQVLDMIDRNISVLKGWAHELCDPRYNEHISACDRDLAGCLAICEWVSAAGDTPTGRDIDPLKACEFTCHLWYGICSADALHDWRLCVDDWDWAIKREQATRAIVERERDRCQREADKQQNAVNGLKAEKARQLARCRQGQSFTGKHRPIDRPHPLPAHPPKVTQVVCTAEACQG